MNLFLLIHLILLSCLSKSLDQDSWWAVSQTLWGANLSWEKAQSINGKFNAQDSEIPRKTEESLSDRILHSYQMSTELSICLQTQVQTLEQHCCLTPSYGMDALWLVSSLTQQQSSRFMNLCCRNIIKSKCKVNRKLDNFLPSKCHRYSNHKSCFERG